jgi:hypothetical protein
VSTLGPEQVVPPELPETVHVYAPLTRRGELLNVIDDAGQVVVRPPRVTEADGIDTTPLELTG